MNELPRDEDANADEQPPVDGLERSSERPDAGDCQAAEAERSVQPGGAARDALYEQIGLTLVNAGVLRPAAEFIADVRRLAGTRVSPREVVVAVEQLAGAEREVSAESVAELALTLRGSRSTRQQRNADAWRSLGAQLALAGLDGSPEGQRAYIGAARAVAGKRATDALLLRVALALLDLGERPEATQVGSIGKRLAASAPDIPPEQLPGLVERELRVARRETRRPKRPPRLAPTGQRSQAHNPGARKWRPGGRRRRKIQFPKQEDKKPFER